MALTQTTLSLAKAPNDKTLKLASATGLVAGNLIYCEGEWYRATDATLTPTINVVSGYNGSLALPHENGAPAFFGSPLDFGAGTSLQSGVIKSNTSPASVSGAYAADTYLVGSAIPVPPSAFVLGMRYVCTFDMVKTAAGTATPTVIVRIGTAGSTADAAILTFTWGAGTAAADSGLFTVTAHFRLIGSAAVLVGVCECSHALAATGLISTGASGFGQLSVVSSAFDSTPVNTIIGVSFNGGASFSGTNSLVETELKGF
jgi:hypothetical protein